MDVAQFQRAKQRFEDNLQALLLSKRASETVDEGAAAQREPTTEWPEVKRLAVEVEEIFDMALDELRTAGEALHKYSDELGELRKECEEQRARYKALFDFCPDPCLLTAADGSISEANHAAEALFGAEAGTLCGRPVESLVAADDLDRFRSVMRGPHHGERRECELRFVGRDGADITALVSVFDVASISEDVEVGLQWIIRDISEQRTAQATIDVMHEQVRRSEQLSMLGTLAAGLGHDVKNLLFPIRLRLDRLAGCDLPPNARDDIEALRESARYLQQLAVNLQALAERPERAGGGAGTEIASWWEHVQPLLLAAVPRNVTLEPDLDADLPPLAVAPHQLTQVVFNLVSNAAAAMHSTGGYITVRARTSEGGDAAELAVRDTGPGMPPEAVQRVSQPFYAASIGAGLSTGLGLWLVRGIVAGVGGSIGIHSECGHGTNIAIRLPLLGKAPQQEAARACAVVSLPDERIAAAFCTLLDFWRLHARRSESYTDPGECLLWVTASHLTDVGDAKRFIESRPGRRLALVGDPDSTTADVWKTVPAVWIRHPVTPRSIRNVLGEIAHELLHPQGEGEQP